MRTFCLLLLGLAGCGAPADSPDGNLGDGGAPDLPRGDDQLVVKITATPESGPAPLSVALSGCGSTDGAGQIVDYAWDFGDGTTASGPTVTHVFSVGSYPVRLTITGSQRTSNSGTKTITATGAAAPPKLVTDASGHPRLYFDAAHLADLKARIARVPILGTPGKRMSYVAGYLLTSDYQTAADYRTSTNGCLDLEKNSFPTVAMENPVNAGRAISDCITTIAAGAVLETDPQNAMLDEQAAVNALLQMANVWPQGNALTDGFGRWDCGACSDGGSNLNNGELLYSASVAFDLLYPMMSDTDRGAVRDLLIREARFLYGASLSNVTWWSADDGNNWQAVDHGGLGMAALVLEGESGLQPGETDEWLARCADRIQAYFTSNYDADGVNYEDEGHFDYGLELASQFLLALRNVKGDDRFSFRDSIPHRALRYRVQAIEPTLDRVLPNDGAGDGYVTWPTALLLASVYRDGFAMWGWDRQSGASRPMANNFPWKVGGDGAQSQLLQSAFLYDDSVPIESPAGRLPLVAIYPDFGRALFRSAWDDPNAFFVGVESGIFGSHGKPNQGHFLVDALGQHLAEQGGNYVSTDYNVVTVDGKDQLLLNPTDRPATTLGQLTSPLVSWFGTDTSKAYSPSGKSGGLTHAERHFLFVQPSYVVAIDDLADGTPHQYLWQLHAPGSAMVQSVAADHLRATVGNASLEIFSATPMGTTSAATAGTMNTLALLSEKISGNDATLMNLLYPSDGKTPLPAVQPVANGIGLHAGDDAIVWRGSGKSIADGMVISDGAILFARSPSGTLSDAAVIEGTQLIEKTIPLVTTSSMASFSIHRDPSGIDLWITGASPIDLTINAGAPGTYFYSVDGVVIEFFATDGTGSAKISGIDARQPHHLAIRSATAAATGCQ